MRIKKTDLLFNKCKCGVIVMMQKFIDWHEGEDVTVIATRYKKGNYNKLFIGFCPCGNQVFFNSYVENKN